jgi:hypothetical protein
MHRDETGKMLYGLHFHRFISVHKSVNSQRQVEWLVDENDFLKNLWFDYKLNDLCIYSLDVIEVQQTSCIPVQGSIDERCRTNWY